jgi:hypothetical protein
MVSGLSIYRQIQWEIGMPSFVEVAGGQWGWWYGLNYSSTGGTASQNDLRMVDVSPYLFNGQRVFATVETDNSK